jgi:glycosyltransferase involved in cell wall biosynthesis
VPEGIPVHHHHRLTLAQARNAGLNEVETEWTIHLDADDELGEGYIEAMATGTADVRAPAVQHLRLGEPWGETKVPRVFGHTHLCEGPCLRQGNWCCIGTCVRTELARGVGWEEFGWSEDWALFARLWKQGASFEAIPEAIYRAHHARGSRNRVARNIAMHWHREIEAAVWPEEASIL